ncbi:unnamed protein product [Amoebophrya sp. A25]|nr:unnamed protein product [Amoebophrya sp. A25]|eukprot:GSA25T00002307001.1
MGMTQLLMSELVSGSSLCSKITKLATTTCPLLDTCPPHRAGLLVLDTHRRAAGLDTFEQKEGQRSALLRNNEYSLVMFSDILPCNHMPFSNTFSKCVEYVSSPK